MGRGRGEERGLGWDEEAENRGGLFDGCVEGGEASGLG
jgi:hypothetical protein